MATFRFDLNQEYSERLEADAAAKRMNIQEYIRYKLFGEVTIFSVDEVVNRIQSGDFKNKEFTVAMADVNNVVAADFVGIVSGNNVKNKIEKAGWTAVKGEFVNAPIFDQLPLVLECKLVSYDENSEVCIGDIVNVSVDENILNEKGKVDLTKFKPICYDCDTHGYYALGNRVGNAFCDGLKLK